VYREKPKLVTEEKCTELHSHNLRGILLASPSNLALRNRLPQSPLLPAPSVAYGQGSLADRTPLPPQQFLGSPSDGRSLQQNLESIMHQEISAQKKESIDNESFSSFFGTEHNN